MEVEAMVQPAAFSATDSHFTTSFEIYGSFESSIVVVQIRSKIYNRELLSQELIQYCADNGAKEILVVGASDACFLSGEALEKNDRFRSAAKVRDSLTHIEVSDIHSGGLVKSLLEQTSDKLSISAILVLVSGLGYMETRVLSEQLALHVLSDLKVVLASPLIEPTSIKQLVANPPVSLEVGRIV
jgi:predicted ATP-grasp superfamily ATP-dependent carboligase